MSGDGANVNPRFVTVEEVLSLHGTSIAQYGGATGVRDIGLLESAVAQPAGSFGNQFAHEFPFGMAAAYTFFISRNHPSVDGNKRAGFAASVVFLRLNGWNLEADEDDAAEHMLSLVEGQLSRSEFVNWLQKHSVQI